MASANSTRRPWWAWTWPVLALVILGVHKVLNPGAAFAPVEAFALITTVFAAVYDAEVIARSVEYVCGPYATSYAFEVVEEYQEKGDERARIRHWRDEQMEVTTKDAQIDVSRPRAGALRCAPRGGRG